VVAIASVLALVVGCAQIESQSVVEILPRPDAPSLVLGPPGGEITARGVALTWAQDGDRLALELTESRTCASVRHVPVVRIERIHRKTSGGALWFEYGFGGLAMAVGLAGLIKPEAFSQAAVDMDGMIVRDKASGYRIGGIFTGIGTLLLTAAVVDTMRSRNEVRYTDAYRRESGDKVECRDPLVPLQGHSVELLVGGRSSVEATDEEGRVQFVLPMGDELSEKARAAVEAYGVWEKAKAEAEAVADVEDGKGLELGPPPEALVIKGVLRIDKARALAIDFLVPYGLEAATLHRGEGRIEPLALVDPSPRVRRVDTAEAE